MRKIGYHGWKTWELSFDDFRIPKANVLIGRDEDDASAGFKRTASWLSVARIHTAARAIGLARGALEDSIAYAQARVQFGRPIGDFQAIRFKIAEMATEIEAARQLMYPAAEQMRPRSSLNDDEASMAKLFATEMAERVTSEGIQIHGGAGYTSECAVERYWRDARLTKIFEGTSEIQQRIISDAYLAEAEEMIRTALTGAGNYFEDFEVGQKMRHARGTTVGEVENQMVTKLVMNTADAHFNEHRARNDALRAARRASGSSPARSCIGLATQDTAENALAELRLDKLRFRAPVFHGDTLTAYTEVLSKRDADREDAGVVRFKHWGVKQDGTVVFEGEREVLIKRRSYWGTR